MSENKTGKYLKYALGEILLVMIGILLALQVNNWNVERMNRLEEIELLKSLEKQFVERLRVLNNVTERYTTFIEQSFKILDVESMEILTMSEIENGLGALIWAGTYDSGRGALEGAISSGRIELIKNKELKFELSTWEEVVRETQDNELAMRDYVLTVVGPKLSHFGLDLGRILPNRENRLLLSAIKDDFNEDIYKDIIRIPEIRSLVKYRLAWMLGSEREFKVTLAKCKSILEAIQSELK